MYRTSIAIQINVGTEAYSSDNVRYVIVVYICAKNFSRYYFILLFTTIEVSYNLESKQY